MRSHLNAFDFVGPTSNWIVSEEYCIYIIVFQQPFSFSFSRFFNHLIMYIIFFYMPLANTQIGLCSLNLRKNSFWFQSVVNSCQTLKSVTYLFSIVLSYWWPVTVDDWDKKKRDNFKLEAANLWRLLVLSCLQFSKFLHNCEFNQIWCRLSKPSFIHFMFWKEITTFSPSRFDWFLLLGNKVVTR